MRQQSLRQWRGIYRITQQITSMSGLPLRPRAITTPCLSQLHIKAYSKKPIRTLQERIEEARKEKIKLEEAQKAANPPPKPPSLFASRAALVRALQSPSICFRPGSKVPAPITKEDKHALATAEKYFRGGYKFLYSASTLSQHSTNFTIPEVIVLGASNVGKSTFLNGLVGNPDAARVSSKPGSTVMTNSFGVGLPRGWDHRKVTRFTPAPKMGMILVDSPGYGFHSKEVWGRTIIRYIEKRAALKGAVVLLAMDKEIHPMDIFILKHLARLNKRTLVMVTKADNWYKDKNWPDKWAEKAAEIRQILIGFDVTINNGWQEGDGWIPDIYITAAGSKGGKRMGNCAGVGGARRAILELAGFNTSLEVDVAPSVKSWEGEVVPFEDIYQSRHANREEEMENWHGDPKEDVVLKDEDVDPSNKSWEGDIVPFDEIHKNGTMDPEIFTEDVDEKSEVDFEGSSKAELRGLKKELRKQSKEEIRGPIGDMQNRKPLPGGRKRGPKQRRRRVVLLKDALDEDHEEFASNFSGAKRS